MHGDYDQTDRAILLEAARTYVELGRQFFGIYLAKFKQGNYIIFLMNYFLWL